MFERIIIIGYGQIANDVLIFVHGRQKNYGYYLEFIEHDIHPFNAMEQICRANEVPFKRIIDDSELALYLCTLYETTLIISANNNYLFPKELVQKDNVTIINFHNALLPNYPGRNATTWVIYRGEKETGITWHYVTEGVDDGDVIIQKSCLIEEGMKAYELAGVLMQLAFEGFMEIFDMVLKGTANRSPQCFVQNRKVYNSKEIPGNGKFNMTDDPQYIYRLLRSVDYGKPDLFPHMRTTYCGEEIEVLRYMKVNKEKIKEDPNLLYLPLDENNVLKIKYQRCKG